METFTGILSPAFTIVKKPNLREEMETGIRKRDVQLPAR